MEQIIGETSEEKPRLIGCEAMTTCLVPSEGVLPFLYAIFYLSPPIVDRDYSLCFHVRVGYNKSDTGEEFTHMPFYLTDNPSGLVPFLSLVIKLDHLYLNAAKNPVSAAQQ